MKKLLSMILAIVMVASLVTVFAVSSSADDYTQPTGLTVTMGTTYATAGSEALVDIYVKADTLDAQGPMLRDWQFVFDGAEVSGNYTVACEPFEEGSTAKDYGFVNFGKNQIGNTCASDAFCTSSAKVLCKGGAYLATVGFTVPAEATGEIEVTISNVDVMHFQDDALTQFDVKPDVTVVPGKIIVVDSVEGTTEEVEGEGEDFVVPSMSEDGKTRITDMLNADGDPALTGEFGVLTIPASILNVSDGLDGVDSIEAVILKSTALEDGDAKAVAGFGSKSSKLPVYILDRPNGCATTPEAFDTLSNTNKQKVDVQYLLQPAGFCVIGNTATFFGGIAADDTDFQDVAVSITFAAQGRTFCTDTTKICYTVVSGGVKLATTDEASVGDAEVDATAFAYISGASVKGMPAGDYTAEVTFYATTEDANGNPIVVCGNTETYEFTIA